MSSSTPTPAKLNKGEQCVTGSSSPDDSNSSHASPPMMVEHPNDNHMACCNLKGDNRSYLDRLLRGYTKFMGPGINQDRGLKLMQYTIWMFSYCVSHRLKGSNSNKSNAAALVIIRDALKKLYNEMSFARYVLRLLGLPPAMEAAYNGSWSVSTTNNKGLHKFLGRVLAWSMIGYYPLEAGAYIQWQTPKLFFPNNNDKTVGGGGGPPYRLAEKLSAWSCRFWLLYTLTEIVQCWLKLREEKQKLKLIEQRKKNDDYKENDDDEKEEEVMVVVPPKTDEVASSNSVLRNLRLQILRDVLFTLPAIHWSLPNWDTQPWLSDPVVNTLMWLESVVCMYQSVVNFNESE